MEKNLPQAANSFLYSTKTNVTFSEINICLWQIHNHDGGQLKFKQKLARILEFVFEQQKAVQLWITATNI